MSLWPGYHAHKMDEVPDPILTEIPKLNINIADLGPEKKIKMPRFGTTHYFPNVGIRTANAIVAFEEFEDGDTVSFCPKLDVVALVLKGKAEITYYPAGTHYTEEKRTAVEEGDVYLVPNGWYLEWKVVPGSRFRHVCFMMPD